MFRLSEDEKAKAEKTATDTFSVELDPHGGVSRVTLLYKGKKVKEFTH